MRSALRALMWEQTKPILPVMLASVLASVFLNTLPWMRWRLYSRTWLIDPEVSSWYSIGVIVAFFIVLLLTSADPNDLRPRFGTRLYRLPVKTFTIVTTLFLIRIVLVTVEVTTILALHIWWTDGSAWSNGRSALHPDIPTIAAFVATYAILQAIGWSVGNTSTKAAIGVALLFIGVYVGGLALTERWHEVYRPEQNQGFPPLWFRGVLEWIEINLHRWQGLLACLAGAYAVIYAGVALDRRGWFQNPARLRDMANVGARWRLRSARRFKSPQAAQRWFEWRRMGLILPGAVIFVLGMSVLVPTVLAMVSPSSRPYGLRYLSNVIVFQTGALFTGALLSAAILRLLDRHDERIGLARFVAVRPLSTWRMACARFEACLISVAIITTALVVLSLAWSLVAVPHGTLLSLWFTHPGYWIMRAVTFVFWAAFLWGILLVAATPLAIFADRTAMTFAVIALLAIGSAYMTDGRFVLLAVLAVAVAFFTVYRIYVPAYRHGLIDARVATLGAVVWCLTLALYTLTMIPTAGLWTWITPGDCVLAAILCTVPVIPLAGVPLAIHGWRHNQAGSKGWMI